MATTKVRSDAQPLRSCCVTVSPRAPSPVPDGPAPRPHADAPGPRSGAAVLVARTRARVHETVLSVLHEEGLDAVTHLRVAQRGDVARATLYRHWPTREDLILDALAHAEVPDEPPFTGDLRADLVTYLDAMRDHLCEDGFGNVLSSLVGRAGWDPTAAALLGGMYSKGTRRLRARLVSAAEEGRVRRGLDLDRVIAQLVGPVFLTLLVARQTLDAAFAAAVVDDVLTSIATVGDPMFVDETS